MKIKIVKTEWTDVYVNDGVLIYDKVYDVDVTRVYEHHLMVLTDKGTYLPLFNEEFEIVKEEINDKV